MIKIKCSVNQLLLHLSNLSLAPSVISSSHIDAGSVKHENNSVSMVFAYNLISIESSIDDYDIHAIKKAINHNQKILFPLP